MKVIKSKKGYYYKIYSDSKKVRIAYEEYKKIKKIKKGGNNQKNNSSNTENYFIEQIEKNVKELRIIRKNKSKNVGKIFAFSCTISNKTGNNTSNNTGDNYSDGSESSTFSYNTYFSDEKDILEKKYNNIIKESLDTDNNKITKLDIKELDPEKAPIIRIMEYDMQDDWGFTRGPLFTTKKLESSHEIINKIFPKKNKNENGEYIHIEKYIKTYTFQEIKGSDYWARSDMTSNKQEK